MSRKILVSVGGVVAMLLLASPGLAQVIADRAPVPKQLLTARSVFIGNGGSESYGAESYFDLTKYDGGPNRAYNSFYGAIKDWGHYQLVGSVDDADVSLLIRFANPIVDRDNSGRTDGPHDWVRDPQIDLSINDPRTGLILWRITEHIEPGRDRAADNRHFDEAVGRLVDDLERLILTPEGSVASQNVIPPGAVRVELVRRRTSHAVIGGLLGGVVGGFAGSRTANYACPAAYTAMPLPQTPFFPNTPLPDLPVPPDFSCAVHRNGTRVRNEIIGSLGGMLIGSLIGWALPVSF